MNQKRFRDIAVTIDVMAADRLRLKEFMKQELSYYNALVDALGPRCRTFPETLLALHKDWERLFAQIAYEGKSIRNLERAGPDHDLPKGLEPFRKFLLDKDAHGKRFLSDRMYSIMSVAGFGATIHPLVRKNMAATILEYFKEQAGRTIQRNDSGNEIQDVYKKAPEMLVQYDIHAKRHLQLPRQALYSVVYDEDKESTLIQHCYSENPIVIQGHDLAANNHWNMIIIHQEPGVEIDNHSPWMVDIKSTSSPYLIKYVDLEQSRSNRMFDIAKRKSY